MFIIEDLDLLEYGEHVIKRLSGRNDISVQIVEQADYERADTTELVLSIDQNGNIIPAKL